MLPKSLKFLLLLLLHCQALPRQNIHLEEHAVQGQPEEVFANVQRSFESEEDIPSLFTGKTIRLLSEAIDGLSHTKTSKTKKWLEFYIFHMARLTLDLQERTQKEKKLTNEHIHSTFESTFSNTRLNTTEKSEISKQDDDTSFYPKSSINDNVRNQTTFNPESVTENKKIEDDDAVQQLHAQATRQRLASKLKRAKSTVPRNHIRYTLSDSIEQDKSSNAEVVEPYDNETSMSQQREMSKKIRIKDLNKSKTAAFEMGKIESNKRNENIAHIEEEYKGFEDAYNNDDLLGLISPNTNETNDKQSVNNEKFDDDFDYFNHSAGVKFNYNRANGHNKSVIQNSNSQNSKKILNLYNNSLKTNSRKNQLPLTRMLKVEHKQIPERVTENSLSIKQQTEAEFSLGHKSDILNAIDGEETASVKSSGQSETKLSKGSDGEVTTDSHFDETLGNSNDSVGILSYLPPHFDLDAFPSKVFGSKNVRYVSHLFSMQPERFKSHPVTRNMVSEGKKKYNFLNLWQQTPLLRKEMEKQLRAGKVLILSDSIVSANFEEESKESTPVANNSLNSQ